MEHIALVCPNSALRFSFGANRPSLYRRRVEDDARGVRNERKEGWGTKLTHVILVLPKMDTLAPTECRTRANVLLLDAKTLFADSLENATHPG